ncbi:MAG: prephenate dehydrogenase/arogenate dehydrogenase family protein [Betaproteobacteria bacterium]|nr:MAG: prephenate dehydrogenase/arogenate dehydrogenase family protein [Betaproteobacteria bacterium]
MRLAVIGVGLIGGSFALGLKQAGKVSHVVGVGRSRTNLELARDRRIIDSIASDPSAAARDADLVLVAAPVAQFARIFQEIGRSLAPGSVVTDAGSTKRDVVAAARSALGARIAQFVPGHPVAGAELSGAAAATAGLFLDRRVVLTPLPENRPESIQRVEDAWKACGARITRLDPEEHDAVLAAVSHLPHLLAYALVHDIAQRGNAEQLFSYAAGGFRDFTRIASSHPEMWRDICIANRDRLLQELGRYRAQLGAMEKLLQAADAAGLEKLFAGAREARDRWLKSSS